MKKSLVISFLFSAVLVAAFGQNDQEFIPYTPDKALSITFEHQISERFWGISFFSPSIAQGLNDPKKEYFFSVYLPKSYFTNPSKRYPVVYGLHGIRSSNTEFVSKVSDVIDNNPNVPECILVGIHGSDIISNNFFANSEKTSFWDNAVANEVRYLVDSKYRTIKSSKARMIAGFSMGGYGAWNIGLKHPDVFGYIWTLSPGANSNPDITFKVENYKKLNRNILGIVAVVGKNDFSGIPSNSGYLIDKFKNLGIDSTLHTHNGAHVITSQIAEDFLLPFLTKAFGSINSK